MLKKYSFTHLFALKGKYRDPSGWDISFLTFHSIFKIIQYLEIRLDLTPRLIF